MEPIKFTNLVLLLIAAVANVSSFYTPTQYEESLLTKIVGYRLPNDTVPRLYSINLEPHVDAPEFTFDGTSRTVFDVVYPTQSVIIHVSKLLEIDKTYTNLICADGTVLKPISQKWNAKLEFFNVRFGRVLEVGNYAIKFRWRGHDASETLRGFYRATYEITSEDHESNVE